LRGGGKSSTLRPEAPESGSGGGPWYAPALRLADPAPAGEGALLGHEVRTQHFDVDGEPIEGWLSPPPSGRGPGVVVVHDAEGLGEHVRQVCGRLAREGFVALAPDLYRGRGAEPPHEAAPPARTLETSRAVRDLRGAVAVLLGHEAVEGSRVGVLGLGMGGALALAAAEGEERIGAVVDLYGDHAGVRVDPSRIHAAVLGLFAEKDAVAPPPRALALQEELRGAGVRAEIVIYDECGHAFLDDTRPELYHPEAAPRAWRAVLGFLRAELR